MSNNVTKSTVKLLIMSAFQSPNTSITNVPFDVSRPVTMQAPTASSNSNSSSIISPYPFARSSPAKLNFQQQQGGFHASSQRPVALVDGDGSGNGESYRNAKHFLLQHDYGSASRSKTANASVLCQLNSHLPAKGSSFKPSTDTAFTQDASEKDQSKVYFTKNAAEYFDPKCLVTVYGYDSASQLRAFLGQRSQFDGQICAQIRKFPSLPEKPHANVISSKVEKSLEQGIGSLSLSKDLSLEKSVCCSLLREDISLEQGIYSFSLKEDASLVQGLFRKLCGSQYFKQSEDCSFGYHLQPVEFPINGKLTNPFLSIMHDVNMGLEAGYSPELATEGSGGVYFMKDSSGLQNVAVFKPIDEEAMTENNPKGHCSFQANEGLKTGTKPGEGAIREVAAYILDHPQGERNSPLRMEDDAEGFAGVPPTSMVQCFHSSFNYNQKHVEHVRNLKLGSLQQYVHAVCSCEEMGTSFFSVNEVHKITVLDLRLANTDRHSGNILVCKKDKGFKLVPIDHGYCLPERFGECTFEWLYWPQASQPYEPSTLEYIESLDAEQDISLLHECGWELEPKCARVLRVSTMVLKKGAAASLTPFQIGLIMTCNPADNGKPPINLIIEEAEVMTSPPSTEDDFLSCFSDLLDDYIAGLKPTWSKVCY